MNPIRRNSSADNIDADTAGADSVDGVSRSTDTHTPAHERLVTQAHLTAQANVSEPARGRHMNNIEQTLAETQVDFASARAYALASRPNCPPSLAITR